MEQQRKMEESFQRTHREFIANLNDSLDVLDKDIQDAQQMQEICTDEWCRATESYLDELGKMIFSISEPRWLSDEDSRRIKQLRNRLHDLYGRYKNAA